MGDRTASMQETNKVAHSREFRRRYPVARPSRVSTVGSLILATPEWKTEVVKLFQEEWRTETLCDLAVCAKWNKKLKIKIHIRDLRRSVKDKHHLSLNKLRSARCAANNNTDGAEAVLSRRPGLIARKGQSWKGYHHRSVRLFHRNVVSKQKKKTWRLWFAACFEAWSNEAIP